LHWAAYCGKLEILKVIVGNGHSVFAVTGGDYPKTVLQVAAKYGDRQVCEFLVANGLDPHEVNVMTSDGSSRRIESDSAVTYARNNGFSELAKWLDEQPVAQKKDGPKIKQLVEANNIEGLKAAAGEGYDINDVDESYTGLHWAAYCGKLEILKVIVGNGHSVFAVTGGDYPKTVLQVAAKYGDRQVCEFLVANGLDPHEVNVMTSDGSSRRIESDSAVTYARNNGFSELAKWLDEQPVAQKKNKKDGPKIKQLVEANNVDWSYVVIGVLTCSALLVALMSRKK